MHTNTPTGGAQPISPLLLILLVLLLSGALQM